VNVEFSIPADQDYPADWHDLRFVSGAFRHTLATHPTIQLVDSRGERFPYSRVEAALDKKTGALHVAAEVENWMVSASRVHRDELGGFDTTPMRLELSGLGEWSKDHQYRAIRHANLVGAKLSFRVGSIWLRREIDHTLTRRAKALALGNDVAFEAYAVIG
jgi:hypothetical protein